MTKYYRRFLVEKIVVTPDRVRLIAKDGRGVRLMACGGKMTESPVVQGTEGLSPTTVDGWLGGWSPMRTLSQASRRDRFSPLAEVEISGT